MDEESKVFRGSSSAGERERERERERSSDIQDTRRQILRKKEERNKVCENLMKLFLKAILSFNTKERSATRLAKENEKYKILLLLL